MNRPDSPGAWAPFIVTGTALNALGLTMLSLGPLRWVFVALGTGLFLFGAIRSLRRRGRDRK